MSQSKPEVGTEYRMWTCSNYFRQRQLKPEVEKEAIFIFEQIDFDQRPQTTVPATINDANVTLEKKIETGQKMWQTSIGQLIKRSTRKLAIKPKYPLFRTASQLAVWLVPYAQNQTKKAQLSKFAHEISTN